MPKNAQILQAVSETQVRTSRRELVPALFAAGEVGPIVNLLNECCTSGAGVLNVNQVVKYIKDAAEAGQMRVAAAVALDFAAKDTGSFLLATVAGDLCHKAARLSDAEALYLQALEIDPAAPRTLVALAHVMDALDRPLDARRAVYAQAVQANPHDRVLLGDWLNLMPSGKSKRQMMIDIQKSSEELIGSVITTLFEAGDTISTLELVFGPQIARFRESEAFQSIDAIWLALSRLQPLPSGRLDRLAEYSGLTIQLYFLLRRPPVAKFVLNRQTSISKARDDYGLNLKKLRDYLTEQMDSPSYWLNFLSGEAQFASPTAKSTVMNRDRFCAYQERAVADQTIRFLHPVDDVEVEPIDSFIFNGRTVLTFPGSTAFLLICGGAGSKILCGYLIEKNILFDFGASIQSSIAEYAFASLFAASLKRTVRLRREYEKAIASQKSKKRKRRIICLAIGSAQNFAHHLWNFHTGLERLVKAGIARNVDEIYYSGTQFFGPVKDLFPEFTKAKFIEYPRGILDPHPFSSNHLLIQPGGYFIPATLTERLTDAMSRAPAGDAGRNGAPDTEGRHPVVWIGLRLGDKSWYDQENGVADYINRLGKRYPNALFLLDGFSYPIGFDDISDKWLPTVNRLQDVVRAILGRCDKPENVRNMVGDTLRESVLWAGKVDLYVTPHGTSQHKVGWLTKAPGIIYASWALESVPEERRPGCWESEIITMPYYLFCESVDKGARKSINDRRSKIDNVIVDIDALVEKSTSFIEASRS